jgi:hypothetical protein
LCVGLQFARRHRGRSGEFSFVTHRGPNDPSADEDNISAIYDRGILTVSVPLAVDHPTEKRVEIVETISVDEGHDQDDPQPELVSGA